MTQTLTASGLNPFAVDGPNQAVFVWDQLGFADTYDIRVDQGLLGLDIPGLSAGFDLHLGGSVALVFTFSFDLGSLGLDYALADAVFADQTDKGSVLVPPQVDGEAWTGAYYRNHTIELATKDVGFESGAITVVPPDLSKEFLDVSLNYSFSATAGNFGVEVDLPFIPTFGYSLDSSVDLINLGTGGSHSSPYAGSIGLYHLAYGGELFNQDSGPITGYINVPTPPEYDTASTTADTANPNLPALVLTDDANTNFAQISVDLAQEITNNLGIPLAIDQDFGPLHLSLALINLVATLGLKIGQEITFTPQAVLVTMTEMATGQTVSGELGKPLYLDLPTGEGVSDVQVSYQLFGDLQSVTGIKLDGSLDLGLLSGSLSNSLGIDFSLGFGPLVSANWGFESSLLPLLTLHDAVSTGITTQTYHIYTERTPDQGGEGDDTIALVANDGDLPFHGNYGNDTLIGNTLGNYLLGDAGNDSLEGRDGNDTLTGGTGADTLLGGEGDERLYQNAWDLVADVMDGGDGIDLAGVDLSGMVTSFSLDFRDAAGTMTLPNGTVLTSIERVQFVSGFGNDSLHGTGNRDFLAGGYGRDTLDGAAPGSELHGDGGDDLLISHVGAGGYDEVFGGTGTDTLELHIAAGVAPAVLDFTAFHDQAIEPGTHDYVNTTTIGVFFRNDLEKLHYIRDGGDADTTGDTVTGGALADTIETGGGDDSIDGGAGLDSILAGAGDDTVRSVGADALLDGGDGTDTLYLSRLGPARNGVSVALNASGDTRLADGTIIRNFEKLSFLGSEAGDTVRGGADGDTLSGFGGSDSLDGGAGADQILGGAGDDTVVAAYGGADTLDGGEGTDLLKLDASADTVGISLTLAHQASGGDTLADGSTYTNFERLGFIGGSGGDTITGGDGEIQQFHTTYVYLGGKYVPLRVPAGTLGDIINGGAGDDAIDGGGGRDIISGGAGNDTITLSAGGDQIDGGQEADNSPGHDTLVVTYSGTAPVFTAATETLSDGNGHTSTRLVLSLADGTTVRGIESILYQNTNLFALAETVPGSPLDDEIAGSFFNDCLDGGLGNDTLFGNGGRDTLLSGQGDDQLLASGGGSSIDGGEGTDTLVLSLSAFGPFGPQAPITGSLKDPIGGGTLSDGTSIKGIQSYSLSLGTGNDVITVGAGHDSLQGGGGDDTAIIDRSDSLGPVVAQIGFPNPGGFGGPTYGNMLVFQDGMMLTFFNHYTILGGQADDRISLAQGFAFGVTADGVISGNGGNDSITGSGNADRLDGGSGNDTLLGGAGNDSLVGGTGSDSIDAGYGADTVQGGDDADSIDGGYGNDQLAGGAGNDTLVGNNGSDTMAGGDGNDLFVVDSIDDLVIEAGNAGMDTVQASLSWTLGANLEALVLTAPGNTGTGNALDNLLLGSAGADTLLGLAGNDTIDGGGGADSMAGGTGDDRYLVDNAGDLVKELANAGTDTVVTTVNWVLGVNLENLVLLGGATIGTGNTVANDIRGNDLGNSLNGGAGNDTLTGGTGTDLLNGGAGADSMAGGGGDDVYTVDNVGDVVVETAGGGIDRINASVSLALAGEVENLLLTGAADLSGTGNLLGNSITGNLGANLLQGLAGADTLMGGGGNDTLVGGEDADRLTGGLGADVFRFNGLGELGDRITDFASGVDTLQVSAGGFGGGLMAGMDMSGHFVAGAKATKAFAQFVYTGNGSLYWDADGTGAEAAVLVAMLSGKPAFTASDLQVIA